MDIYNVLLLHYIQLQNRTEDDIIHLEQIIQKESLYTVNETSPFLPEETEIARKIREGKKHEH